MQPLPFFGFSLYQMFLLFVIWSFIGWCIEVCYMTLETGEYQNRGFLSMPICPIYGFGVIMIVTFFRPISGTFIPLMVASSVLCTSFELAVGVGMEKIFHNIWWDYSHEKFNFKGYICLKVSILWGLGCVIVVRIVEPFMEGVVNRIPIKAGIVFIWIMSVLIAIDLICSVMAIVKLNSRLKRISEISSNLMLSVSVRTGKKLASGTKIVMAAKETAVDKMIAVKETAVDKVISVKETAVDKVMAVKENAVEKIQYAGSANMEKLRAEYEKLIGERDIFVDRMIRAFPAMRSHYYSDALTALKNKLYGKQSEDCVDEKEPAAENVVSDEE